jgi:GTPase SAR1 family protein
VTRFIEFSAVNYKQTVTLESGLLDVEIIDVSVDDEDGFPIDQIQWADAVLIVYSITDRESFDYAVRSLGEIRQIQNGPVSYLVANKADLDHLRMVRTSRVSSKLEWNFLVHVEEATESVSTIVYSRFAFHLIDSAQLLSMEIFHTRDASGI